MKARQKKTNSEEKQKRSAFTNLMQYSRVASGGGAMPKTPNFKREIPASDFNAIALIDGLGVTLRAQARGMLDNPTVQKYLRYAQDNIVGDRGFNFQSQAKKKNLKEKDDNLTAEIESAFTDWRVNHADAGERNSFTMIIKSAVASLMRDGEAFLYLAEKPPYGLAVAELDSKFFEIGFTDFAKKIIQSVQVDDFNAPVAYYYGAPGDKKTIIPADRIIHLYSQDLPGQIRGLSKIGAALYGIFSVGDLSNIALSNARKSLSVLKYLEPTPDASEKKITDFTLAGEGYAVLPYGYALRENKTEFAAQSYGEFHKANMRLASSGMPGISYNTLSGDGDNINFSTIRDFTLKDRDAIKGYQQLLIEKVLNKIFNIWLENALTFGKIRGGKPSDYERARFYEFTGRRWEWIDPLKDAKASTEQIRNMTKSPAEIIRERGRDPDEVLKETAEFIQKMKAGGFSESMIESLFLGQAANNAATAQKEPEEI
jgi:lambda family phage portal protein